MITNPVIPIVLENNREYNNDFKGFVYFCDIDKTYLDTKFETIPDLISTLFDFAIDKVNISGMNYLLKGVRRQGDTINGIYFLSASPKEMKNILSKKLLFDGVQSDGICLRDHLFYIKKFKFKSLKKPFSFKLLALLVYNIVLPLDTKYILIGDDTESDADIYKTFKKILEDKKIDIKVLRKFIDNEKEISEIMNFQNLIKPGTVEKIYINNYIKSRKKEYDKAKDRKIATNNDSIIYFDHSMEVMLDLYSLKQMDKFFIKKAYKELNFDINFLSEDKQILLNEILK